jgi:sulfate adenylyltransferase
MDGRGGSGISVVASSEAMIDPYGGSLVNLLVSHDQAVELKEYAKSLPSITLTERLLCDLELLATGAFSPIDRFMGAADYDGVLRDMRTSRGFIFPLPVTLPANLSQDIKEGADVALRDMRSNIVAVLTVDEIFERDKREFARQCLQTEDPSHPLVTDMNGWGRYNISGKPRVVDLPRHYDFPELRLSPGQTRKSLEQLENHIVVAFQTRNPLHGGHEALIRAAMSETGGVLLLHPVVGVTRSGDVDRYSRVRSYKALVENYYSPDEVLLALLPLAMRFAGPREALWHAIIRRNYGASHFIVGRDHASPGVDSNGVPFYKPDAAQKLVEAYSSEIGVCVMPFREFSYVPESGKYEEQKSGAEGKTLLSLSGTEVREQYLHTGRPMPHWYMRPEVACVLQDTFPPREKQGVCIWLTGLSAAGKSTIAEILAAMLERFGRRFTLLDGDVVRTHLSAGLAFDRQGRNANVRRIGFVASEVVKHGGVAICAAISPYIDSRAEVRKMFAEPNFIEVFVDTPLEICETRDPKGIYAKARTGEIKDFTGISDVYEPPPNAELTLSTVEQEPHESANIILDYLLHKGFIKQES